MRQRWPDLSVTTRTPSLPFPPTERRATMETRFYQTQEITLPVLAEGLVLEYQAQGYEAQHFGDVKQTTVQLKRESTLRAITSFEKVLAIFFQRVNGGTLVKVGAQD
jgi:hypothetical protein